METTKPITLEWMESCIEQAPHLSSQRTPLGLLVVCKNQFASFMIFYTPVVFKGEEVYGYIADFDNPIDGEPLITMNKPLYDLFILNIKDHEDYNSKTKQRSNS